jgi:hypothetical protein
VAVLAGLAVLHTTLSLTRSRRFSPDSMNYVNVAENLAGGRGLVQNTVGYGEAEFPTHPATSQPFAVHAPLYPILIAGLALLGIPARDAALLVPALSYPAILIGAFLLMSRLYDPRTALAALLPLVLCHPLRSVTAAAWAEAPGLLFLVLSFLLLLRRPPERTGSLALAGAGLLAGLAFATRYPLVVALPLGAALLHGRDGWGRAARRAAVFGLGFGLVALPIFARNALATGRLSGAARIPTTETLAGNVATAGSLLLGEYLTAPTSKRDAWVETRYKERLQAALLVVSVVGLAARLPRPRRAALRALFSAERRWILLAAAFGYLAFVVAVRSVIYVDLDSRVLSPAYLLLMCAWGALLAAATRVSASTIAVAVSAAAVVVGAVAWHGLADRRPASSRKVVRESRLLTWIRDRTGPRDLIVAEDSQYVTFHVGRPTIYLTLHPRMRHVTWNDVGLLRDRACRGHDNVYLVVWTHAWSEEDWLYSYGPFIADLALGRASAYPGVEERKRFPDGVVYRAGCPPAAAGRPGG